MGTSLFPKQANRVDLPQPFTPINPYLYNKTWITVFNRIGLFLYETLMLCPTCLLIEEKSPVSTAELKLCVL